MLGRRIATRWPRLVAAEPLEDYRLRLTYLDGFVGEVDFANTVAEGGIFAFMQDKDRFKTVQVAHNGSALLWVDDEGDAIDFCADAQRMIAEAMLSRQWPQSRRRAAT